jgi:hypothetical protein
MHTTLAVGCTPTHAIVESLLPCVVCSDVLAARRTFDELLKNLPAPRLDHDGPPNQKLNPKDKSEKKAKREKKRTKQG